MRYNNVSSRPATAKYIANQRFDPSMSTVLARAVKEKEREREGHEYFTEDPADCLAFKYWRCAEYFDYDPTDCLALKCWRLLLQASAHPLGSDNQTHCTPMGDLTPARRDAIEAKKEADVKQYARKAYEVSRKAHALRPTAPLARSFPSVQQ